MTKYFKRQCNRYYDGAPKNPAENYVRHKL